MAVFALDVFRLEKSTTIFVSPPVKTTGFFVFSPTNYHQKLPDGVSGKLSFTPKQCKVAHFSEKHCACNADSAATRGGFEKIFCFLGFMT